MAVNSQNNDKNSLLDLFEVKCTYCGTTLTYQRKDVAPHRRWPNGYIYCPNCRRPIGHSEDQLIRSGEEISNLRKK